MCVCARTVATSRPGVSVSETSMDQATSSRSILTRAVYAGLRKAHQRPIRNVFVFETRNQVLVDFARLDKNRHSSLSSPSLHLFDSQFSDNRCNNSLICWSPSSKTVCAVLLQLACSVTLRGSVWILVNFCLHTAAVVLTWQSMLSNTTNKMQDPRKRW